MSAEKAAPSAQTSSSDVESQPSKPKLHVAAPPFTFASLFKQPVINPLNGKAQTLPIFNLKNPYSRNFHLSWLSFFVAFLSWLAIRTDLDLTAAQIGNSNVTALASTFLVRFIIGPFVDRFGPRWTMAALLILGAIPSGLAGTINSAGGLYTIRFFIGILGGTFVPCQAWTTAFFDKNIVGTANALVGGWGNLGGGVTFCVQVGLFESLTEQGLTDSQAWRAAFAVVPVPILFFVAALDIFFGTDCPAGKWSARHTLPASAVALQQGHQLILDRNENVAVDPKDEAVKDQTNNATVKPAHDDDADKAADIDVAVAEHATWKTAAKMAASPVTWLTPLLYMTSFGTELAIDANIANVYYAAHQSSDFGQLEAGFYGSIYGFMNIFARAVGGIGADMIYRRYGVGAKKWLCIALGVIMGVFNLAQGLWQREVFNSGGVPALSTQVGLIVGCAIFGFAANGANYALVPHVNAFNNGMQSGITGAFGNLGGIWYALMFRFQPADAFSTAFIAMGAFTIGINLIASLVPTSKLR